MSLTRLSTVALALLVAALAACGHKSSGDQPDGGPGGGIDARGTGTGCPGAGEQKCNGTCTNTVVDPDNCGRCGNACGTGQVCLSSGCAGSCPAPLSPCNRTCVDLSSDNANCNTCGNMCGNGMGCVGSA